MNYIRVSDEKYPFTLAQIREDTKSVGGILPDDPTDEQLAPYGYACVHPSEKPVYDPDLEYLREGSPVKTDKWYQTWDIMAQTVEQVTNRKLSEIETAYYQAAQSPVVFLTHTWNGGRASLDAVDGKSRALERQGITEDTLRDINNVEVPMTVEDMKLLVIELYNSYEPAYQRHQNKKLEIENCGIDTACINNVTW